MLGSLIQRLSSIWALFTLPLVSEDVGVWGGVPGSRSCLTSCTVEFPQWAFICLPFCQSWYLRTWSVGVFTLLSNLCPLGSDYRHGVMYSGDCSHCLWYVVYSSGDKLKCRCPGLPCAVLHSTWHFCYSSWETLTYKGCYWLEKGHWRLWTCRNRTVAETPLGVDILTS